MTVMQNCHSLYFDRVIVLVCVLNQRINSWVPFSVPAACDEGPLRLSSSFIAIAEFLLMDDCSFYQRRRFHLNTKEIDTDNSSNLLA